MKYQCSGDYKLRCYLNASKKRNILCGEYSKLQGANFMARIEGYSGALLWPTGLLFGSIRYWIVLTECAVPDEHFFHLPDVISLTVCLSKWECPPDIFVSVPGMFFLHFTVLVFVCPYSKQSETSNTVQVAALLFRPSLLLGINQNMYSR